MPWPTPSTMPASSGSSTRLQALLDRAARDERLVAIALCSNKDELTRHSAAYPASLKCADVREAAPAARSAAGAAHRRGARGRVSGQQRTRQRRRAGAAARPELRRSAQPGHAAVPGDLHHRPRPGGGADHRGRGAAQLARLGLGHACHPARRRADPPAAAAAGAAAGGHRGARALARPRGRVPPQPGAGDRMEPRAAARPAAHAVARRPGDRGVQPRALHPREGPRRRDRQAARPAVW